MAHWWKTWNPRPWGPIWWSGPVPGTSDGGVALIGADLVAIPADIAGRVAKHLEHAAALVANRSRVAA